MASKEEIAMIAVLQLDQNILGTRNRITRLKIGKGLKDFYDSRFPSETVWRVALGIIQNIRSVFNSLRSAGLALSVRVHAVLDKIGNTCRTLMKHINSAYGMKGSSKPLLGDILACSYINTIESDFRSVVKNIRAIVPMYIQLYGKVII